MEKILVVIDGLKVGWGALSHACFLAKRMPVALNLLCITRKHNKPSSPREKELEAAGQKRLALIVETAQAEGVTIKYFKTEGAYAEEIIDFVNHHDITLLVLETDAGGLHTAEGARLHTLRHRLRCRMEVVAPMKYTFEKFERIT